MGRAWTRTALLAALALPARAAVPLPAANVMADPMLRALDQALRVPVPAEQEGFQEYADGLWQTLSALRDPKDPAQSARVDHLNAHLRSVAACLGEKPLSDPKCPPALVRQCVSLPREKRAECMMRGFPEAAAHALRPTAPRAPNEAAPAPDSAVTPQERARLARVRESLAERLRRPDQPPSVRAPYDRANAGRDVALLLRNAGLRRFLQGDVKPRELRGELMRLQKRFQLPVTGELDETTLRFIEERAETLRASAAVAPQQGDEDQRVGELQRALNEALRGRQRVVVDRKYGHMTARAIERFQELNGLRRSGALDPQTLAKLEQLSAARRPVRAEPPAPVQPPRPPAPAQPPRPQAAPRPNAPVAEPPRAPVVEPPRAPLDGPAPPRPLRPAQLPQQPPRPPESIPPANSPVREDPPRPQMSVPSRTLAGYRQVNRQLLPAPDAGYEMIRLNRCSAVEKGKCLPADSGHPQVIDAIVWTANHLRDTLPPNSPRMTIGDISRPGGGPIPHHSSHQNGRQVDIGFFITDAAGRPLQANDLVGFDKRGFGSFRGGAVHFDAPRNVALAESLLSNPRARPYNILVSSSIRNLMLQHAQRHLPPERYRLLAQKLVAFDNGYHHDHFHVQF